MKQEICSKQWIENQFNIIKINFRYDELCEYSITLVEHEELMPKNYVRFHIPREMTQYELFNYLDKETGQHLVRIFVF